MEKIVKQFHKTPITVTLIGICIIVYIVSFLLYGEEMNAQEGINMGAFNPFIVYFEHAYYRLLTANFIHFGILHIAINCYSLFGLGRFVELTLKTKKYCILVICSAFSTTLIPYILFLINGFGMTSVSGGISGVIFGLIGALGALALRYKDVFLNVFQQLAPNVILMLLISFLIPSISLSGHLSGMIGGFITTYIILVLKPKYKAKDKELLN